MTSSLGRKRKAPIWDVDCYHAGKESSIFACRYVIIIYDEQ